MKNPHSHSLSHCFNELLQFQNFFFKPGLYWCLESRTIAQILLQHIPKILIGVGLWTLCWLFKMWWCLRLPEPQFKPNECWHCYLRIRPCALGRQYGQKIHEITWSYCIFSQLTSFFRHIMLLNLNLSAATPGWSTGAAGLCSRH